MSQEWQTDAFRGSLIRKLEEAIRDSGNQTNKIAVAMEKQVFQRAKSKEEYLNFVARLILHVRQQQPSPANNPGDLGQPDKMQGQMQQQQQQQQGLQQRLSVTGASTCLSPGAPSLPKVSPGVPTASPCEPNAQVIIIITLQTACSISKAKKINYILCLITHLGQETVNSRH